MTTITRLVDVWDGFIGEYVTIPATEVTDWYANHLDCDNQGSNRKNCGMTFNPTLKGVSLEKYLTEINDGYTTEWEEVDHLNMTGEAEEHDEWAVDGFVDPSQGEAPF